MQPTLACPVPQLEGDRILLAHGEGARLTLRLIEELLLPEFDNPFLRRLADGAVLPVREGRLVMTTDSFVVSPLFFPGGDIGKLAVHGTVNDLAVCGARPQYLSLGLIIEEGLPRATLQKVIQSMAQAARACAIQVVTVDTKVVPRGAADGLFVNTTGIGPLHAQRDLGPHRVQPGDQILVSGTLGDHGLAILTARENLGLESTLHSDTAPLYDLVQTLFAAGIDVHFMRDPTRGGLAAVLHEVAEAVQATIVLEELSLPVSPPVRGACELLGLDPLYVANEGKLVLVTSARDAPPALACLRRHGLGQHAAVVGEVRAAPAQVLVRGSLGSLRILDEPSGALFPRIC